MDRVHFLKTAEPIQGDKLLLTKKSPGAFGTHLIDIGRVKS